MPVPRLKTLSTQPLRCLQQALRAPQPWARNALSIPPSATPIQAHSFAAQPLSYAICLCLSSIE
jgi:hypothetical protein